VSQKEPDKRIGKVMKSEGHTTSTATANRLAAKREKQREEVETTWYGVHLFIL
jgi:hypothetical protein